MNDPLLPRSVEILEVHRENADVFTMTTRVPDGYEDFAPGQFNMLYVAGAGQSAISISGDPRHRDCITHTIRREGNVTGQLEKKNPGDRIGLRGPFGKSWPLQSAQGGDLLLIAGGIGLAPLRPVLYHALAARQCYGRISLLVGARSPEHLIYREQLRSWESDAALHVGVTVDTAPAAWRGQVGVVTELIPRADFDPAGVTVMICGPEIMQRFCARRLRDLGVPSAAIYLSLERHMKCAIGLCGHCQLGPHFVCRNGPVFPLPEVEDFIVAEEF